MEHPLPGTTIIAKPKEYAMSTRKKAISLFVLSCSYPNSATATFFNANDWEVCYNALACWPGGHCPKWVNPCDNNSDERGWPDLPL